MSDTSSALSAPPQSPDLVSPTRSESALRSSGRSEYGTIYRDIATDAGARPQRRSARLANQSPPEPVKIKRKAEDSDQEQPKKRARKGTTDKSSKSVKRAAKKPRKRRKRPDHYKPKPKKRKAVTAASAATATANDVDNGDNDVLRPVGDDGRPSSADGRSSSAADCSALPLPVWDAAPGRIRSSSVRLPRRKPTVEPVVRPSSAPPGDPTPPTESAQEPFPPPLESPAPPPPPGDRVKRLNGLTNHTVACFSNSLIQLIAACLDRYDLDHLLGAENQDLHNFGFSANVCKRFDNEDLEGMRRRDKAMQKLRANIKTARRAGNDKDVSTTMHLRALLQDLAKQHKNHFTSAVLWQQVHAFGHVDDMILDPDGDCLRHNHSGDRQECPAFYFNQVMEGLRQDPANRGDSAALWSLFEFGVVRRFTCQTCGARQTHKTDDANAYHELHPPDAAEVESIDLQTLLDGSEDQQIDEKKCHRLGLCAGKTALRESAFLKSPERLVLKINRLVFDKKQDPETGRMSGIQRKNKIIVGPLDCELDFKGQAYHLIAAVFHEGENPFAGHYVTFRKFEEEWALIDDKDILYLSDAGVASYMRDHGKYGEALLLAFERVHESALAAGVRQEEVSSEEE